MTLEAIVERASTGEELDGKDEQSEIKVSETIYERDGVKVRVVKVEFPYKSKVASSAGEAPARDEKVISPPGYEGLEITFEKLEELKGVVEKAQRGKNSRWWVNYQPRWLGTTHIFTAYTIQDDIDANTDAEVGDDTKAGADAKSEARAMIVLRRRTESKLDEVEAEPNRPIWDEAHGRVLKGLSLSDITEVKRADVSNILSNGFDIVVLRPGEKGMTVYLVVPEGNLIASKRLGSSERYYYSLVADATWALKEIGNSQRSANENPQPSINGV